MAKYRPEMKKYYYDPTKYKTYLDQLGIKYPTVREPAVTTNTPLTLKGGEECPGEPFPACL